MFSFSVSRNLVAIWQRCGDVYVSLIQFIAVSFTASDNEED